MPDQILDADSSDPALMGWMEGLPPPPEKRIRWAEAGHMRFPTHRFAYSHMREFMATTRVGRGSAVWDLPLALRDDLDTVSFEALDDGRSLTWADAHKASFTDAVLILHRGAIVYERYMGVTRRDTPHIAFSVTKSFVGTLAEMLIAEGRLEPVAPVGDLIPELASSGFGDATLRQVMDMTTALDFSEEYTDPTSGIGAMSNALGLTPRPSGYAGPEDVFAFLPTIRKKGEHGERFTYRTCNTEVLGWIVARTEGERLDRVLSRRIWQPLGMEQDADFLIDTSGMPLPGAGSIRCCATWRALAKPCGWAAPCRTETRRFMPRQSNRSGLAAAAMPSCLQVTSGSRAGPTAASGGSSAATTGPIRRAGSTDRRSMSIRWRKWSSRDSVRTRLRPIQPWIRPRFRPTKRWLST